MPDIQRATTPCLVVGLADVTRADVGLVGGKAANLGELLRAGFAVPDGFVLTADAFARFCPADGGDADDAPIRDTPAIAAELREILRESVASLGDAPLAVRSSAIDEDGGAASFAGQYETVLNVRGLDGVADAVRRCWRSARAERVREYRSARARVPGDLAGPATRLAVLVQLLIAADVSAVVFSANPVTGRRDEVVVEASWGMGESLVGGTVTPDSYHARKRPEDTQQAGNPLARITHRRVATKRRMTVLGSDGTREVDVPRCLQAKPALDDRRIHAAARLALTLERAMGRPVDVECAFADGRLYVLQCRPITTLTP